MELIVGIIIASIATLAILYSVLYVQSSSYELRMKERAHEELKSHTDLWKAKIAANDIPDSGSSQNNTTVCLDENDFGDCVNEATIRSSVSVPPTVDPASLSKRKGLKTEITWETRSGSERSIDFYVEQLILSGGSDD